MLDLFRRPTDPKEYTWLYSIPAAVFGGGFIWASSTGVAGLVQAGYLVSTMLSIGALSGLSSQVSFQELHAMQSTRLHVECMRKRSLHELGTHLECWELVLGSCQP